MQSFKRIERKFIIDQNQKDVMVGFLLNHCDYDDHCQNEQTYKVMNVYYDTEDNYLISNSIEKPNHIYKEKLRARKYPGTNTCFLEIKKKYNGVVGKRRIMVSTEELDNIIHKKQFPDNPQYNFQQISKEIEYFLFQYPTIKENFFLSYDRLGFFGKTDHDLRITFDSNIKASRTSFNWERVDDAKQLLPNDTVILEIKTSKPIPLWLANFLSKEEIYRHTFSKYGTAYKQYLKENNNDLIQKLYF